MNRAWYLSFFLLLVVVGVKVYFISSSTKASTVTPNVLVMAAAPIINPSPAPAPAQPSLLASSYLYNLQGQLERIVYPDGTHYTCAYDPHGDKIRETNRSGRCWTYAYDRFRHPTTVIDPEGRVTHPSVY